MCCRAATELLSIVTTGSPAGASACTSAPNVKRSSEPCTHLEASTVTLLETACLESGSAVDVMPRATHDAEIVGIEHTTY